MISYGECIEKKKGQHHSEDVKKVQFSKEAHITSIAAGRLT